MTGSGPLVFVGAVRAALRPRRRLFGAALLAVGAAYAVSFVVAAIRLPDPVFWVGSPVALGVLVWALADNGPATADIALAGARWGRLLLHRACCRNGRGFLRGLRDDDSVGNPS